MKIGIVAHCRSQASGWEVGMIGIKFGALALAGMAICGALCWGAWGQTPPPNHGAWADKDAEGRPAPMTFGWFHQRQLLYSQVVAKLTDAGCKREEAETFIRFYCEASPKQWYLTKPGQAEHPGMSVSAEGTGENRTVGHARMLSEKLTLNPEPPSIEWREAYAVWLEKLPNRYRPPAGSGRVDWVAILKDAPLTYAETRTALTYEMVIAALEAASDCKREDPDAYTVFDCATSKTRWYLTREGMPAHGALAVMFSRSYLGGEEASYSLGMNRRFPAATAIRQPQTPEEIAARTKMMDDWIRTLPGQMNWGAPPQPLGFSLAGSPFVEDDFGSRPLSYDAMLQNLTGGGCARKEVGDYIAFNCKGNPLLFVLSAPGSDAHAAMMIAEADPSGRNMYPRFTRMFFDPLKPQTEESRAAHSKWTRGLEYLPASQLR
jgi:hypothetical protein